MVAEHLKILIVEDEAAHAEAISRAFKTAGKSVEIRVAGTLQECRRCVAEFTPDIALMDLNLPDGRGMEILTCPPEDRDFPILIMTAYGSEQMAVQALKAGALDYVVKSPEAFSAMPRAVERALREWKLLQEHRRADDALRQSEDKYRHIVENLGREYLFYRHDTNGVFSYVSPSVSAILGYSQQEALFHFTRFLSDNPVNEAVVEHTVLSIQGLQQPSYEVEVVHKDGSLRWLEVTEYPVRNQDGSVVAVEGIARDVTEQKNAEKSRQASLRFLETVHKYTETKPLLEELASGIKDYTGCDSVAIRVLDEAGNIPYHAYAGFSTKFVELESPLSVKSDQCMCINVIKGTTNPLLPFYTKGGSFYMNATTRFLATVSEKEKGKTRNVCNREGYESVALVPFRSGDRILGLIHVADHRENMVPLKMVEQLESAAMQLGTAFQRANVEAALRESEERYRRLFENSLDAVLLTIPDGRILSANPAACRMFGKTEEEICALGREALVDTNDPSLIKLLEERARNGRAAGELTFVRKDGSRFPGEVSSVIFKDAAGSLRSSMIIRDITERKQSEDLLRQSEEKYRNVVERAHDGIIIVQGGIIKFANARMAELDGSSLDQLVGTPYASHVHPSELPRLADIYQRRMAGEILPNTYETILIRKDGSSAPAELNAGIITYNGKPADLVVIRDITERKRMNEALRASERQYRQLVDNALVGVYRSTPEGKFLYVNDALVRILECENAEEMLQLPIGIRYKRPEDREAFLNVLKEQGKVPHYEFEVPTKTGKLKTIAVSAVLEDGFITGMVTDVTERRHLEVQLRHAQKMEAVGTLAGGIAHDFNNILNVIIGYGSMVLDKLEADSPLKVQMNEVLAAAERAAVLTKRLLAFSRKQLAEVKPVNVNETVINIQKMLVRTIGEDIDFHLDLADRRLVVMADAGQLEQVLMNLTSNARDAMPEGGRLTIGTSVEELDNEYVAAYGYGRPGMYAIITVSDTGHGIDAETRKNIFEPFFTTKDIGKGTGLGLAISYGIIKQHNGYINVYSEPGQGTLFKIYLPLLEEAASLEQKAETAYPVKGGNETVLVAEDDASLRKLTRIALESFGYIVITAEDGEAAITKFMENREKIHLVILDMIMPKKNGKEVSEVLRKVSPGIKIVFVSGYTMNIIKNKELTESGFDFIHKPVRPQDLLRKVREVLDK